MTASGKTAHVLDAWGKTKRDIAAQIAAAKAPPSMPPKRPRADTTAQKTEEGSTSDAKRRRRCASNERRRRGNAKRRGRALDVTVARPRAAAAASIGPARRSADAALPGSPPSGPQTLAVPAPGPRTQFLRAAHAAACRIFGTTLGPEANEAHRNHFHVDMAERKYKKICD